MSDSPNLEELTKIIESTGLKIGELRASINAHVFAILAAIAKLDQLTIPNVLQVNRPTLEFLADLFAELRNDPNVLPIKIRQIKMDLYGGLLEKAKVRLSQNPEQSDQIMPLIASVTEWITNDESAPSPEVRAHLMLLSLMEKNILSEERSPQSPPVIAAHWLQSTESASNPIKAEKPDKKPRQNTKRNFPISSATRELIINLVGLSDTGAVAYLKSKKHESDEVVTDLRRLALFRVGRALAPFNERPSSRSQEFIDQTGITETENWTSFVSLLNQAGYFSRVLTAWLLDPVNLPDPEDTRPEAHFSAEVVALVREARAPTFRTTLRSLQEQPEQHAVLEELCTVTELLFVYLDHIGSRKRQRPESIEVHANALAKLSRQLGFVSTIAVGSKHWIDFVTDLYEVSCITRSVYLRYIHQPTQLAIPHHDTGLLLCGMLAKDTTPQQTLREAVANFYATTPANKWETNVRFMLRIAGNHPTPFLSAGITKIERTTPGSTTENRGFLYHLIVELMNCFVFVRTHGSRITESYPDGISESLQRTIDMLGVLDADHWHRIITQLVAWNVISSLQAQHLLQNQHLTY